MKKDDSADIKLLHKKYQFFDKPNITILYEFCEEDYHRTDKILAVTKDIKNPKTIIKTLLEKPERGHVLLAGFEKRYDEEMKKKRQKQREKEKQSQNKQEGQKDNNPKKQEANFPFFNYTPSDVCMGIYIFLDPYSAIKLSSTCRRLRRVSESTAFSEYYRRICVNLFQKYQPVLPYPSRFLEIKDYVLKNVNFLGPNARHAVEVNLRKYVWQEDVKIQKESNSYYQSFGGYKQLYFKAPRLHFNGFYLWKHQYRKEEDRNLLKNQGNVHLIQYFRYLRFFEDGSVISAIFPSRQKAQVIEEVLSKENLERKNNKGNDLMIGEYVFTRDRVTVKVVKSESIFTFELQILPREAKERFKLSLLLYKLRVLSRNEIVQTLEQFNPQNPVSFLYYPLRTLGRQNSNLIRSSCL